MEWWSTVTKTGDRPVNTPKWIGQIAPNINPLLPQQDVLILPKTYRKHDFAGALNGQEVCSSRIKLLLLFTEKFNTS